jgi:hypothetical protein
MVIDQYLQILWHYVSQLNRSHVWCGILRPELHIRRPGSFQYRQHQLDVRNLACYANINLRLCLALGL